MYKGCLEKGSDYIGSAVCYTIQYNINAPLRTQTADIIRALFETSPILQTNRLVERLYIKSRSLEILKGRFIFIRKPRESQFKTALFDINFSLTGKPQKKKKSSLIIQASFSPPVLPVPFTFSCRGECVRALQETCSMILQGKLRLLTYFFFFFPHLVVLPEKYCIIITRTIFQYSGKFLLKGEFTFFGSWHC